MKIGIYIQNKYARRSLKNDSWNKRIWPGISMLKDCLARKGFDVGYCSSLAVLDYDVLLVSIISSLDWYSFIAEREGWASGGYVVIAGGAGVLNVRPVLKYADIFVFGRGENLIVDIIRAIQTHTRMSHPSVCYADEFDVEKKYLINQSSQPYPYQITLANGDLWKESVLGCQKRCLFCAYTWHRKHLGGLQRNSGISNANWNSTESTLFEIDLDDPDGWFDTGSALVGLDGLSSRLRFMVNKRITKDMAFRFFRGIGTRKIRKRIKLFNIVGYPTEGEKDYKEFLDVMVEADSSIPTKKINRDNPGGIFVQFTPFRPMPATPAAWWPMSYVDYRRTIIPELRKHSPRYDRIYMLYYGKNFHVQASQTTEGLPTVILDTLILRGVESDAETVRRIAKNKKFWAASNRTKQTTLEKYVDINRIFGSFAYGDLPTRYLTGYVELGKMYKAGQFRLKKYGVNHEL